MKMTTSCIRVNAAVAVPPVPSMHLAGLVLRYCGWGAAMHAPGPGRLVHYHTWDHAPFSHRYHMSESTIGFTVVTPRFPHKPYGLPWPLSVLVAFQLAWFIAQLRALDKARPFPSCRPPRSLRINMRPKRTCRHGTRRSRGRGRCGT